MSSSRKSFFIDELKKHYQDIIAGARRAETDATEAADGIRAEARQKEDAKGAVEAGRVAKGHRQRRLRAKQELEQLIQFATRGVRPFASDQPIGLGSMVDVSIDAEEGCEERTLFVLPVGAGTELQGPGGDGFISVITPASPVGRALQGSRTGDSFEVVVQGRDREWTVVDLC